MDKMDTVKIKLGLLDRLILPTILPKDGGLVQQVNTRGIINKVEFTPEEAQEFEMKDTEKGVMFNPAKARDIEVELTKSEVVLLQKSVDQLDKDQRINQENLDLVLRIKQLNND